MFMELRNTQNTFIDYKVVIPKTTLPIEHMTINYLELHDMYVKAYKNHSLYAQFLRIRNWVCSHFEDNFESLNFC
jgi:hypothetical protein